MVISYRLLARLLVLLMLELVTRSLAIWRISRLLVAENGPFDVIKKLRILTGIVYNSYDDSTVVSYPVWNPLHCIYCTSIWVMVVIVFVPKKVVNLIGANGAAMLIQSLLEKIP